MRNLLLLAVSILLVAGSITATLGTLNLRDFELRGYVDPTKEQDLPFIEPRMGVNVELLQYDESQLRSQLEMISASGFRWIRQFAFWNEIESQQHLFDWTGWDQLAQELEDFPDLELVAVLMNSPEWAREPRDEQEIERNCPTPGLVRSWRICQRICISIRLLDRLLSDLGRTQSVGRLGHARSSAGGIRRAASRSPRKYT